MKSDSEGGKWAKSNILNEYSCFGRPILPAERKNAFLFLLNYKNNSQKGFHKC